MNIIGTWELWRTKLRQCVACSKGNTFNGGKRGSSRKRKIIREYAEEWAVSMS